MASLARQSTQVSAQRSDRVRAVVLWLRTAPRRFAVLGCLAASAQHRGLESLICLMISQLLFTKIKLQDVISLPRVRTYSTDYSCFSACKFYGGSKLEYIVLLHQKGAVNYREENKRKLCWED